jgi:2-keto-4-pentenoate hydratase
VVVTEPILTGREHARLADVLLRAVRERQPLEPFTRSYPELGLSDACRIRDAVLSRRVAAGERLIGAKTVAARDAGSGTEAQLGLITDGMLVVGAEIEASRLIHPRVEAKLAFVLGADLVHRDLIVATARVAPCLEVVDSRFEPAAPSLLDDIADSFGACLLLIGPGAAPDDIALDALTVTIGPGATAPCDPVTWFDGGALERRSDLVPGSFLLSPPLAPALDLHPATHIDAGFGELGALRLTAR